LSFHEKVVALEKYFSFPCNPCLSLETFWNIFKMHPPPRSTPPPLPHTHTHTHVLLHAGFTFSESCINALMFSNELTSRALETCVPSIIPARNDQRGCRRWFCMGVGDVDRLRGLVMHTWTGFVNPPNNSSTCQLLNKRQPFVVQDQHTTSARKRKQTHRNTETHTADTHTHTHTHTIGRSLRNDVHWKIPIQESAFVTCSKMNLPTALKH
jgi:hypothetical protein